MDRFALMNHPPLGPSVPLRVLIMSKDPSSDDLLGPELAEGITEAFSGLHSEQALSPSTLLWIMRRSKDEVFASGRNLPENRPAFLQAFIHEVTDFVKNSG